MENDKLARQILKRDFTKATYIGEEGDAACMSKTKLGALRKFRALYREDGMTDEALEIELDCIGIGWFRLTTEEEKKQYDDSEWLVSYKEVSPYEVWVLSM